MAFDGQVFFLQIRVFLDGAFSFFSLFQGFEIKDDKGIIEDVDACHHEYKICPVHFLGFGFENLLEFQIKSYLCWNKILMTRYGRIVPIGVYWLFLGDFV